MSSCHTASPSTGINDQLEAVIEAWQARLQEWSANGSLLSAADEALVLAGNTSELEAMAAPWASGDFATLPPVRVLAGATLPGAAGAYGLSTGTIYLNGDWLSTATQPEVIAVLSEELGHHLDGQLNAIETPGDEGEHFSLLLHGVTPTSEQLAALQAENDHTTITVDGRRIAVEQAVINGNANANNLFGGTAGDDQWYALAGNDTINPGLGGSDYVDGGADLDLLVVNWSTLTNTTGIYGSINPDAGGPGAATGYFQTYNYTTSVYLTIQYDYIERFNITGTGNNDQLQAGSGNDTINGGAGNDTINAGLGANTINGGANTDLLGADFSSASTNITLATTPTGYSFGDGAAISNTITNIETFAVTTGDGNDVLSGGANNDTFVAAGGNDNLSGGGGDDWLNAGLGSNTIDGGSGSDYLTADLSSASTNITMATTPTGYSFGDGASISNTITGIEGLSLTTGSGNDTIDPGLLEYSNVWGSSAVNASDGNDLLVLDYSTQTNTSGIYSGISPDWGGPGAAQGFYYTYDASFSQLTQYLTYYNVERFNITGTSVADTIYTGNGNDTINGGAGNDTINAGLGANTINGGADTDLLIADLSSASTNITLATTPTGYSFGDGAAITNAITNIETFAVTTGDGNDVLSGGANNDTFVAAGGNDNLSGGGGDDWLNAGLGSNTIDGGSGSDYLTADLSSASTNITMATTPTGFSLGDGASINNTITGIELLNLTTGSGNDTINPGLPEYSNVWGSSAVNASDGNDLLVLDYSTQTNTSGIYSGISPDWGGPGAAQGYYYTYDATFSQLTQYLTYYNVERFNITGTSVADTIYTGNGNDTINGGDGADNINAGAGNDTVTGGVGNDTITGGAGNDLLNGGTGNDSMIGGNGNDTYVVDAAGDVVSETTASAAIGGIDLIQSSVTRTLGINQENLTLTGVAAINGTGNGLNNVLIGNGFSNSLTGAAGTDTLDGGAGADILVGGDGNDIYIIDDVADVVSETNAVALTGGVDLVQSLATTTLGANVENLTLTGSAAINGTGNGLNNTILGNSGANTLDGGGGTDTLVGGDGNDTYIIDDATDVVSETNPDALTGGVDLVQASFTTTLGLNVENLTLTGSAAINGTGNGLNNTILGNSGANTLDGGAGADTLDGGDGNDTYIIADAADVMSEINADVLSGGTDLVESSATTTLGANIENLTLTGSAAINGTGNSTGNTILGNSGANTLDGGGGTDSLVGGDGNDTYIIDDAADVVSETNADVLSGGTDLVQSSITTTLGANVENLTLTGSAAINGTGNGLNNTILGNSAANTLDGGGGTDSLVGGDGNDTYIIDDATDVVSETNPDALTGGTDLVQSSITTTLGANVENLTLTGSAAINGTGNSTGNTILGNSGDNTLDGGAGADTLDGGDGNDTYIIDDAADVMSEINADVLTGGTDLVESSATTTLGANIENLTLTGSAAINGTGNGNGNTILGNSGANTLDGGGGTDSLVGGDGNDTYIIDDATDVVSETNADALTGGTDLVQSSITTTLGLNLENLTLTGSAAINGTGNGLNNTILGNSGANTLDGGGGTDSLVGGDGNDTYIINDATDVVSETNTSALTGGTDLVQSSITTTLTANVEKLTLTGSAAINGTGNALNNTILGNGVANILDGGNGNDTLTGGGGADTLTGGGGNDNLNGGTGADSLTGGAGNDTYVIDNVGDQVIETLSTGGTADLVQSSITTTLGANIEKLTLTGSAAINGTGNGLNNTILGNGGANTLDGGVGADTITGGAGLDTLTGSDGTDRLAGGIGNDQLTGGLNADTFRFDAALNATTNRDTVTDFNLLEGDIIQLENSIFTALTTTGTLASAAFSIGAAATTAAHRILYDSTTGILAYDSDGTGSNASVAFAVLSTSLSLTETSFVIT